MKTVTEYFEDALRKQLVDDYKIVAAEKRRKEQERIVREQLEKHYQDVIEDKDLSAAEEIKEIHDFIPRLADNDKTKPNQMSRDIENNP